MLIINKLKCGTIPQKPRKTPQIFPQMEDRHLQTLTRENVLTAMGRMNRDERAAVIIKLRWAVQGARVAGKGAELQTFKKLLEMAEQAALQIEGYKPMQPLQIPDLTPLLRLWPVAALGAAGWAVSLVIPIIVAALSVAIAFLVQVAIYGLVVVVLYGVWRSFQDNDKGPTSGGGSGDNITVNVNIKSNNK